MRALVSGLAALALAASPAAAGDLVVQVRGANSAGIANAVVTLYPGGRPAPLGPARPSYQIAQRDLQFSPFVLRLYTREQARSVRFERPGIVPLGCNIHDNMIAFIDVVDTGFAARTDLAGQASFTAIPGGPVLVRVWHPWLRAPGNQIEMRVTVPANGRVAQTVSVNLRPPPRPGHAY
jgi:hypothetical protein